MFLVSISNGVKSQAAWDYEMVNYMAAQKPNPDPDDDEEVKRRFQSHFIKNVYLENVFKSGQFYGEDDNAADYGLVNEMMLNQFAEYLVDTNFIDLSNINLNE